MSDIIQLLPDSVANQIAAGEVIQRPASVIKELVENAIDADAKTIHVLVVDAGRTSIQVIDDGIGMSETDARLAFERHATSKIRQADDLFNLHTMGFRGEALASIAAVAQVELTTRPRGAEVGVRLSVSGSKFMGQETVSCPEGSNFKVENLFYNVPARRKFLKSNTTELNQILSAFERIVLVYPNIHFTFHSNGAEVFNLRACALRQRIVDVFGKRISQELLPLDVNTSVCQVSGFVGKPESARKRGAHQYFFVNDRYMKHPYFHKAVINVYERLVPTGEQVPYFIYFKVPPQDIDVNIHPVKTEIKFENEQMIWQILTAAVKDAIGRFVEIPAIDFDTKDRPDIPVFDSKASPNPMPKVEYNPKYNPFDTASGKTRKAAPEQWEQLYEGLVGNETEQSLFGQQSVGMEEDFIEEKSPIHYQYKGCYIMTAVKSGLMIIDQHRAHVRVLYEEYLHRTGEQGNNIQKLLFPEMLELTPSDDVLMSKILPDLNDMGFELTPLGGGSYAVNGVPAGLEGLNYVSLLESMIEAAKEKPVGLREELQEMLALNLAHHAAIPYGQVLGNEEMEQLVNRLFACSNVNYAPDGKVIMTILKQEEIEKMLG